MIWNMIHIFRVINVEVELSISWCCSTRYASVVFVFWEPFNTSSIILWTGSQSNSPITPAWLSPAFATVCTPYLSVSDGSLSTPFASTAAAKTFSPRSTVLTIWSVGTGAILTNLLANFKIFLIDWSLSVVPIEKRFDLDKWKISVTALFYDVNESNYRK